MKIIILSFYFIALFIFKISSSTYSQQLAHTHNNPKFDKKINVTPKNIINLSVEPKTSF